MPISLAHTKITIIAYKSGATYSETIDLFSRFHERTGNVTGGKREHFGPHSSVRMTLGLKPPLLCQFRAYSDPMMMRYGISKFLR